MSEDVETPSAVLSKLTQEAIRVAKTARRNKRSLSGDNYYGNKLAQLRTDATNAFSDLSENTVGDTSALAELIEAAFSATTPPQDRVDAAREISHTLHTKRRKSKGPITPPGNELFPLTLIANTQRGYLIIIAKQMNVCFREACYDACAVMMRRLVEIVVIEAFERQNIASKIEDRQGNYFQLTDLIDLALKEPTFKLSRNAKNALPKLRNLGHRSAHGRYFTAQRSDIEKIEDDVRIVVEEFLRHADLL